MSRPEPVVGIHDTASPVILLVIDVQAGLDDPRYGERSNPGCEEKIDALLSAFRSASHPVVFTRHLSLRPGSRLAPQDPGSRIKAEAAPREGEPVFTKSTNSAFKNAEFAAALEAHREDELILVGMATDACVTATAREARDLGYRVTVASDACATFARDGSHGARFAAQVVHEVSLAALAASMIRVCSSAAILDELGHPSLPPESVGRGSDALSRRAQRPPALVRPATASDAEAISRLSAEFVSYLESLGDTEVRGISAEEYLAAGFGERPAFAGLVAEREGETIGYLLYHEGYDIDQGGRVLHVVDLFVRADARRSGAGRALMHAAREVCRRVGGVALLWLVYPPNRDARAFYEALGGRYVDERVMSWQLCDRLRSLR